MPAPLLQPSTLDKRIGLPVSKLKKNGKNCSAPRRSPDRARFTGLNHVRISFKKR
jgi:hypothetical protein